MLTLQDIIIPSGYDWGDTPDYYRDKFSPEPESPLEQLLRMSPSRSIVPGAGRITDSLMTTAQEDEAYPMNRYNDPVRDIELPDSPLKNLGNLKDLLGMLGGGASKGLVEALIGNDDAKDARMLARQMALAQFTSGLQDKAADRRENRTLTRDLLRTNATPIDPKKYKAAQEMYEELKATDKSDDEINTILKSYGFKIGAPTMTAAQALFDRLGLGRFNNPPRGTPVLEASRNPMHEMIQQLGVEGAIAELTGEKKAKADLKPGTATLAPQGRKIRDKKTGRTGTLKPGGKLPAGAEFID